MIPTQARFLFIPPRNPYSHRSGILIHISPERLFTCSGIRTKPQLAKIGFNVSALILASAGAYEAHRLVLQRPTDKEVLLALTIGASLYFVANTVLVAGVLSAVEGKPLGGIWRQCHLWAFPYYMVGGVLAAIMLVLERSMGWQVSLTLCPLMYLIYQWYRSFADVSSVRA